MTNQEQELPSSSTLNTQTTHPLEEEGLGEGFSALSGYNHHVASHLLAAAAGGRGRPCKINVPENCVLPPSQICVVCVVYRREKTTTGNGYDDPSSDLAPLMRPPRQSCKRSVIL